MSLGRIDARGCLENAWPLFAGIVEEVVDAVVSDFGIECLTKFDDLVLPVLLRFLLVPDLGEDQLEDFVKLILAAVGKHQFFKFLNDLLEVEVLLELQQGLASFEDIFGCLPALGYIEKRVVKLCRIRPVKNDTVGSV